MALKDLLQSQKTIRELKTETAALRLEKEEAARQKEKMEAKAAAVSREADREAAGREREQTEAVEAAQRALFEALRPLLLSLPTARRAIAANPDLLAGVTVLLDGWPRWMTSSGCWGLPSSVRWGRRPPTTAPGMTAPPCWSREPRSSWRRWATPRESRSG